MKEFCKNVTSFCESLLFPNDIKCIFCGKDVKNFQSKPYCDDCAKILPFNNGNRCQICSEPIDNEAVICDTCQKNPHAFKKAFCPFVYEGIVRSAILSFKDSNQRYLAAPFAKFIAAEIVENNLKFDGIAFIPMTAKKLKKRSFNQSKLLAQELGKVLGVQIVDIFEKLKDEKSQKQSSYAERQKNIIGQYALKKDVRLKKSENLLIVDDIITTGATINYCASLVAKKVKNVYVCAVARNRLHQKQVQIAGE